LNSKKIFLLIFVFGLEISCSFDGQIFRYEFVDGWKNSEIVELNFLNTEESQNKDLFFVLRHDKSYEFSNIFLISNLKLNGQKNIIDTIEYTLSQPNGKWNGETKISTVEHILKYKKNVVLFKDSLNTLTVRNSMRRNNEISPIESLENILDIGLLVKSIN
tara:strand:- start:1878 stop:2360 length:483 start_codon:yes stop_codon:yes gene_type:complete